MKQRLRGPELNLWFLWNLRKLGKHEIDNFKAAPLASVWPRAKFEAIDLKMFFYFSQYVNNIYFYNLGFALSLVLKATYFETRKWPFSVPCEQRFLSCMAFSVYEVIRVACPSHSWFVYSTWTGTNPGQTNYAQTSQANDFVNTKSHARGLFTEPSNVVGELQVIVSMREKWPPIKLSLVKNQCVMLH